MRRILVVILVLALLAAAAFAGWYFFLREEAVAPDRFETALKEHNYQAAATVYKAAEDRTEMHRQLLTHVDEYLELCQSEAYTDTTFADWRGLEIFEGVIQSRVLTRLNELGEAFYRGELAPADAKTFLARVGKFSFADETVKTISYEMNRKDVSDTAYAEGMKAYNEKDPDTVLEVMPKVSFLAGDQYRLAQEAMENAKDALIQRELIKADEQIAAEEYDAARKTLSALEAKAGSLPEIDRRLADVNARQAAAE